MVRHCAHFAPFNRMPGGSRRRPGRRRTGRLYMPDTITNTIYERPSEPSMGVGAINVGTRPEPLALSAGKFVLIRICRGSRVRYNREHPAALATLFVLGASS